jgi:hypothetical protein
VLRKTDLNELFGNMGVALLRCPCQLIGAFLIVQGGPVLLVLMDPPCVVQISRKTALNELWGNMGGRCCVVHAN